jgi:hypothetical protein
MSRVLQRPKRAPRRSTRLVQPPPTDPRSAGRASVGQRKPAYIIPHGGIKRLFLAGVGADTDQGVHPYLLFEIHFHTGALVTVEVPTAQWVAMATGLLQLSAMAGMPDCLVYET